MANQRVILLRSPKEDADEPDQYRNVLEQAGLRVTIVPTLTFSYGNLDSLADQLESASSFSGMVFTSPRAVYATAEALQKQNSTHALNTAWMQKPCFVVGERTGCLVRRLLHLDSVGEQSGNAADLADFIISELKDDTLPLLFPCGQLKKETLPVKLKSAGIPLQCTVVYTSHQHPDLLLLLEQELKSPAFALVFFSPSGVTFSKDKLTSLTLPDVKYVAIGPSTRQALENAGIKVHRTADKPTPEALLEALSALR